LIGWTTGDYKFINPIARGSNEATLDAYVSYVPLVKASCSLTQKEVSPYIDILSGALRKLKQAYGTLWRGQRWPAEELGTIITLPGFTSTSHIFDEALDFVKKDSGSSATRTLFAIVSHKSGKDINSFSVRKAESEVLFPLDSRFEVVECSSSTVDEAKRQEVRAAEQEMKQNTPEAKLDIVCLKEV